MKKADWSRSAGIKALAFLLAVAAVPVIALCVVSLICAYQNNWPAAGTEAGVSSSSVLYEADVDDDITKPVDPAEEGLEQNAEAGAASSDFLYETDFVRSAIFRQKMAVWNYYGDWQLEVTDSPLANPSYTNFRFRIYTDGGAVLFSNLSDGDYLYQDLVDTFADGTHIQSGAAAEMFAQDEIFWAYQLAARLYGLYRSAALLLTAASALFLFLFVYLTLVSGRRPGREEAVASWQEKIPFDLYLALVGSGLLALIALGEETSYDAWSLLPFTPAICLALIAAAAVLLLAAWMTLCARVKLGGWWRNTLIFRLLSLGWRVLIWCARTLRRLGQGLLTLLRAIPMLWRTVLAIAVVYLFEYICAVSFRYNTDLYFASWFLGKTVLVLFILYVALQLRRLQAAGAALAAGELDAKVDTRHMLADLKQHGEHLNALSAGMQRAVERQLKSERLKTELITNVSHDIKTPLTSIINYVGLLRRDPPPEQAAAYLEVLDRQSQRLRKLTEDLVEVSKASTGNIAVNAARRSVSELLVQAIGEYSERLEQARLEAVLTLPEQELFAWVDGTLLWRVLDNVFSNACKYALPGTRFYIDAKEADGRVRLSFKNISRDRLNVPADELMERFVRGDASRGGEGSGLGLNIARSLAELQGGTFDLFIDGDLFRVDLSLPALI